MSQVFQRPRVLAGECWWSDTRLHSFAFSSHSSLAVASQKGLRGVWVCDEEEKHQQLSINTRTYNQFIILAWLSGMKYWLIEQVSPQKGHFNVYHVSFPYRYERFGAVNTSPDYRLQKQTLENVWTSFIRSSGCSCAQTRQDLLLVVFIFFLNDLINWCRNTFYFQFQL